MRQRESEKDIHIYTHIHIHIHIHIYIFMDSWVYVRAPKKPYLYINAQMFVCHRSVL